MKQIDELSKDKVFADPVRKVQETMLEELLKIRKEFATQIDSIC